jgi:acyl transferase domain-containing protein/acyl carrier protein
MKESIAIISMACKMPGRADTPDEFWNKVLAKKEDAVCDIPKARKEWDMDKYYAPDILPGKYYVKTGAYLDENIIRGFDSEFFMMSAREANSLDPQHRMLLQVSWEALENAGIAPSSLAGSNTGVYVGLHWDDYSAERYYIPHARHINAYSTLSNLRSLSSGRLSYFFDLQGPSLLTDTACSSALVSLVTAVRALQNHDIELALVGGVSLLLTPHMTIGFSQMGVLSKDGRCKTFSAGADGFAQGEGCNVMILKRLSDAEKDCDNIMAVIEGVAVNHDGRSLTITTPSSIAQQRMLNAAIKDANLDPHDIQYVETHGTGTSLGDYIEVSSLSKVFSHNRVDPLYLGSVKTNIGHLGATAGLAGLMKVVLSIQNNIIPANLHFDTPNPRLKLDKNLLSVPTELTKWNENKRKIAGVSAFGMSGTNAHVIVSGYSGDAIEEDPGMDNYLFTISAKTKSSLLHLIDGYKSFLHEDSDIAKICYTSNVGRDHFNYRLAIKANSIDHLRRKLNDCIENQKNTPDLQITSGEGSKEVAFLFTGQGSQYANMGVDLYSTYTVFKEAIDACAAILADYSEYMDKGLLELLYSDEYADGEILKETRYTQPVLFAFEYALAQLWLSWGVKPSVVMGHSVGEYVAACIAGVFSLKDALKLIAARGYLIEKLASEVPGGMLSILADRVFVEEHINKYKNKLSIAAVNSLENVVVSGDYNAVIKLQNDMQVLGKKATLLSVSHAFHSYLMEPACDDFLKVANTIEYHKPEIVLLSNVTNQPLDTLNGRYWVEHIIKPVLFADSVQVIDQMGILNYIEIGPKPVLIALVGNCELRNDEERMLLPSVRPMQEMDTVLSSLSSCYIRGIDIDWQRFYSNIKYPKIILPNYCFDNKDTWIDVVRDNNSELYNIAVRHALLQNQKISAALKEGQFQFESTISCEELNYIKDHRVLDRIICPASAYIEMLLSGAKLVSSVDNGVFVLHDISIERALEVDDTKIIQVLLNTKNDGSYDVEIHSLNTDNNTLLWDRHVTGRVELSNEKYNLTKIDIENIQQRLFAKKDVQAFYVDLKAKGIDYGSSLQNIKMLWSNDKGESLGYIELRDIENEYISHPGLLDSCFHLLLAAFSNNDLYLPVGYKKFTFYRSLPTKLYAHILYDKQQDNTELLMATIQLIDLEGHVVATLDGCKLKKSINRSTTTLVNTECLYNLEWHKMQDSIQDKSLGDCLIISDDMGIDNQLKSRLDKYANTVVTIGREGVVSLCDKAIQNTYHNIIYLYNITDDIEKQVDCQVVLALSQYIKDNNSDTRLLLVTKGVKEQINNTKAGNSLWQSVIWGFGNTLSLEFDIPVICLDLDSNSSASEDSSKIISELLFSGKETQVAYKDGERYVGRLQNFDISNLENSNPRILSLSTYGVLKSLHMKDFQLASLKENEVRVKVLSSGVNFRDLLRMLGMMRVVEDPNNTQSAEDLVFGYECAGIIKEVGKNVSKFKEGDAVIVYKPGGGIATDVIVPEELLVLKTDNLSFSEAATIPVAYITAAYGLLKCAHLKANDKVLIHNAAGGVGQAAVQIAQSIGAEIYATAHPNKWDFLKSNGIKHVYSSRDQNFKDQIRTDTDGIGVDVILNSLNGEFVDNSVSILKEGGRFCEIGKLQVWDAAKFSKERPDAKFFMYDLSEINNKGISVLLHEIMDMFKKGYISALPVKEFAVNDVEQSMRYIQQAKHIGKISLVFDNKKEIKVAVENASYIVTGGLGGLGLRIMLWLVDCGAKNIVLVSRKKPSSESQEMIDNLIKKQVKVDVVQGDIAKYEDVERLLDHCNNLKGIIHAAGVIEDGLVSTQSAGSFNRVMDAKVQGTWNLHNLTKELDLDYFVCFSSVASLLGSVGQINYSAANAFMDQFAHYRSSIGLPCTSINWGPWAEVGMAASLADRLKVQGYNPIPVDAGLEMLKKIINFNSLPQVSVLLMNWKKYLDRINKHIPFFDKIMDVSENQKDKALLIDILESADGHEKLDMIENNIKEYIKTVIGLSEGTKININTSIFDFGLDSLMAIELKNIIERNVKIKLRSTLLFDYPTVKSLINYIAQEILLIPIGDTEEIVQGDRISSDIGAKEDQIIELQELQELIEGL